MTGMLTSREAWVRFASELLKTTDLSQARIAEEADEMLQHYLMRFPDPKEAQSAVLDPEGLSYLAPPDEVETDPGVLTSGGSDSIVQES